jgi:ribosomal-protein-alanine acetyltransferase
MTGSRDTPAKNTSSELIRRMALHESAVVLLILQESPEASPWTQNGILDAAKNGIAWVAEKDGKVVGFLIGRAVADEFEILNMAVAVNLRRQGIAGILVKEAITWSRGMGAKSAHLEVRASNRAAISLYMRHGFTVSGLRKGYYDHPQEDAILLTRNVDVAH